MARRLKYLFGFVVFFIVIFTNIVWYIYGDKLYETDPEAHVNGALPPYHTILQKTLSKPEYYLETYIENDFGFQILRETVDTPNVFKEFPIKYLKSGDEFAYQVKLMDGDLILNKAPNFVTIEKQTFLFTPEYKDIGRYDIELIYKSPDNVHHLINFDLVITEESYLLGTDSRGRSILALLMEGSTWIFIPGLTASVVATIIGVLLGAYSGYSIRSQWIDTPVKLLEAVPGLLLLFLSSVIFNFNIYAIMFFAGIVYAPITLRVIRDSVKSFVNNDFVESSREIGFTENTILWREIIWFNARPIIIEQFFYCLSFAVLMEVTLSYLGIGVQLSDGVSWGWMLLDGKSSMLNGDYWMLLFPTILVSFTIFGFSFFGNALANKYRY